MSENNEDFMGRDKETLAMPDPKAEARFKKLARANFIAGIAATTLVEDSIIKSIVGASKKYTVPKAALTVAKSGYSFGGGLAAFALRTGITATSSFVGAVGAAMYIQTVVDVIDTVRSMPNLNDETVSEDDK